MTALSAIVIQHKSRFILIHKNVNLCVSTLKTVCNLRSNNIRICFMEKRGSHWLPVENCVRAKNAEDFWPLTLMMAER